MIPQLLRRTKVLRNNEQLLSKKTTTIGLRTVASQQGPSICRRVYLSNDSMNIFATHLGNGNYHIGQQKKSFVTTTLPSSFVASKTFHDPTKSSKKTDIPETVDILRQQFSDELNHKALEGHVVNVKDSFVKVTGLKNSSIGSSVRFENGMKGLVVSLETNTIGVVLLRHEKKTENSKLSPTYFNDNNMVSMNINDKIDSATMQKSEDKTVEPITFPVGTNLIGQILDPLGYPIHIPDVYEDKENVVNENEIFVGNDGVKPIIQQKQKNVPSIVARSKISKPFYTGIKFIDVLHPLGCGQRIAFRGSQGTGKSRNAVDVIINQSKDQRRVENIVKCVYVAIGQSEQQLSRNVRRLYRNGCLEYTTIIATRDSDSYGMQYLAPYSGCLLGEYLMNSQSSSDNDNNDVLIVYDDMSNHAIAVNTISNMVNQPLGAHTQWMHSHLLERSAQLSKENGNGSLTAIPVMDTTNTNTAVQNIVFDNESDISLRRVAQGIVSIVDDYIDFDDKLALKQDWPAVPSILNTSDVGENAKIKLAQIACQPLSLRKMVNTLHLLIIDAREADDNNKKMLSYGFNPEEESRDDALEKVHTMHKISAILHVPNYIDENDKELTSNFTPFNRLMLNMYASIYGFLDDIELNLIYDFEKILWDTANNGNEEYKQMLDDLNALNLNEELTNELGQIMHKCIEEGVASFKDHADWY